jgi:hypothetical protein
MSLSKWRQSAALVALLWLGACCPPVASQPPVPPVDGPPAAQTNAAGSAATSAGPPANASQPSRDAALEQRAKELVAEATNAEPSVTPVLVDLAGKAGGQMIKLEFRLKTVKSTTRKLRTMLAADPSRDPAKLTIDDSLRYTMRIDDEPPGRHLEGLKGALKALEARGHQVVRLKNYWPAGDNYSGTNGVLRTAAGQTWELQFHTGASLEVQAATRPLYEELRALSTPKGRKQELFDKMTEAWQSVPIPKGILEPGALHPRAEIRERQRP